VIKFGYKPFKDHGKWVYMKGMMNWIDFDSREGTGFREMNVRVWKGEFLTFTLISSNWAANTNVMRIRVFLNSSLYTLGWTGLQFYMGWNIVIVVSPYIGKRAKTDFIGPVIATWNNRYKQYEPNKVHPSISPTHKTWSASLRPIRFGRVGPVLQMFVQH